MSKTPYIISFFKEQNTGNEPTKKWVLSLDTKDKKIIGKHIRALQKVWPIGFPLVRCMKDGLWELRIRLNNRHARVFFLIDKKHIVLLHSFIKKSQTTPYKELNLAYNRLHIYNFNCKEHYV